MRRPDGCGPRPRLAPIAGEGRGPGKGRNTMLKKIGLIGGGFIGGVLAQEIAQRGLAREVGLTDPAPMPNPSDPPERQEVVKKQSVSIGKALDIAEGLPTIRH